MDKKYDLLIETYQRIFGMVDAIHFNSKNTAAVFAKYVSIPKGSKVIPITHNGITDCRKERNFDDHLLRLGFIGSEAPYKGLPMLKEVISQLNDEGYTDRISLEVYWGQKGLDKVMPNVHYKGKFAELMMGQIYENIDLLVVPSICYETFSFVTLEALSFGTPVLVSDKVGAKDLVKQYDANFVYGSKIELYKRIFQIVHDKEVLREFNKRILTSSWTWSMDDHAENIINNLYLNNL